MASHCLIFRHKHCAEGITILKKSHADALIKIVLFCLKEIGEVSEVSEVQISDLFAKKLIKG